MPSLPEPSKMATQAKQELIAGRLGSDRLIELDELKERLSAFETLARSLGVEMYWSVILEPTRPEGAGRKGGSNAH